MEKNDRNELLIAIRMVVREEIKSAIGIFIEYADDNFAIVHEQFVMTFGRIDELREAVDFHTDKFDNAMLEIMIIRENLQNKADRQDIILLEHRVEHLES